MQMGSNFVAVAPSFSEKAGSQQHRPIRFYLGISNREVEDWQRGRENYLLENLPADVGILASAPAMQRKLVRCYVEMRGSGFNPDFSDDGANLTDEEWSAILEDQGWFHELEPIPDDFETGQRVWDWPTWNSFYERLQNIQSGKRNIPNLDQFLIKEQTRSRERSR